MITVTAAGVVYRNPKPYLRALHTWHPSPVVLPDGRWLVSFDIGQAVESLDYRTYLSSSADEGGQWTAPVPYVRNTVARPSTHTVRINRLPDGTLAAIGSRAYRDDPEEGIVNRANLGYVPMDVILLTSRDDGATWTEPRVIPPPLAGPGFEACHSIIALADGRCLWPTSIWRGWDGQAPNGMKALAFVSYDRGQTWPEYLDVMDGYADGIIYWEQSLTTLADGRLAAVCWAFNEPAGATVGVHYALSADGRTFSPPRDTGLPGETTKLLALADNRLFCAYRGTKPTGLWGAIARIDGDKWITEEQFQLWAGPSTGLQGQQAAGDELGNLKFGYPQPVRLPNGDILLVFWCQEDCVNNIRWMRIRMQ